MIYQYASAQEYLITVFQRLRAGNEVISIEQFAKRIGIGGSTLKMILSGRRKPTIHHVLSFSRAFRLSDDETSYLEALVSKEYARNKWEENYYKQRLKEKEKAIRISTTTVANKELLSDVIALPLLVEILESNSSTIDSKQLAQKFDTDEVRIRKLIVTFEKYELLQKQEDGQFHIAFDKLNHRILQKKYISNLLSEAAKRVQSEYDSPTSLFVGYAFSAANDSLIQLQIDLKMLMEKYMAAGTPDPGQRIIAQACFQIFPISKNLSDQ